MSYIVTIPGRRPPESDTKKELESLRAEIGKTVQELVFTVNDIDRRLAELEKKE